MLLGYNLVLKLFTLLCLPFFFLYALVNFKVWRHWRDRLGFFPRTIRDLCQALPRPRVWFHAASVGEVSAITSVVHTFKERHPNTAILVSTTTFSGWQQAQKRLTAASHIFVLPLDYPGIMRRTLKLLEPNLLVIAETEIWPNLIRIAKRTGSQVALINGRLSERSKRAYGWIGGVIRKTLNNFDLMAVQSEKDAERFQKLGANPQRIKVIGNVKFDARQSEGIKRLQQELRLGIDKPIFIAGSTRPGEEEILLDAFQQIQAQVPEAVMILAPRHLERLRDVERLLVQRRISFTYRSRVAKELLNFPVILLDTMGELASAYGLAKIAFIGGSLQPFGGHNPLEPASLGVPVLMGPHQEHFAGVMQILLQAGGAQVVTNAEEIAAAVVKAFLQPEQAQQQGRQAWQAVKNYQGAADKTVDLLQKLMLIKNWSKEVKGWRQESLQALTYAPMREKDDLLDDLPE